MCFWDVCFVCDMHPWETAQWVTVSLVPVDVHHLVLGNVMLFRN